MSDAVLIGLFGLIASTIAATGTVLVAMLQFKTRQEIVAVKSAQVETQQEVVAVKEDVAVVKHHTNSLTERLVEQAGVVGRAEGIAQERADGASRAAGVEVDRAAVEANRVAAEVEQGGSGERVASATERLADSAERLSGDNKP